jgi:hypothetical protein
MGSEGSGGRYDLPAWRNKAFKGSSREGARSGIFFPLFTQTRSIFNAYIFDCMPLCVSRRWRAPPRRSG